MCECERCGYLSDEDRTFVANVVQDLIEAKQMFSKYDIYLAVKDELNHLPNYFKVKKEITSIINHVIDEMWDDDVEYLKDFVTYEGKTFAVYHPAEADAEQYPEWNQTDHNEEEGEDISDDESGFESSFDTIELNTDFQGRIYIGKDILEKIGIDEDQEYIAVANYGAEVCVAGSKDVLEDPLEEPNWLRRANGNAGLRISMRNRFKDDSDPQRVSVDIDTEFKMLHIFLADDDCDCDCN